FCIPDYFEDENGNELTLKQMAVILTGNPEAIMFPSGVRQHDIDYMLSEYRPIPLDKILILPDSLEILGYFVRDFKEMEASAFFNEEGGGTLGGSSFGGPVLRTAVSDEEVRSFIMIFRRLCITNERFTFWKARNIFNQYLRDYPLAKWVKGAAKQYQKYLNKVPSENPFVAQCTFPLTRKELFETYFYTHYVHQPDEKHEQLFQKCLDALDNKLPVLTWLFLTELWYCGHKMACVAQVITGVYDRYCRCHHVSPNILKSISECNPGMGILEKKYEQRDRIVQKKCEELALSLWNANGCPEGGPDQFLDQAKQRLWAVIDN
ncbi:MAG: hypothetical protein ABSA26_04475, partial [Thermoguttaceae bacterium]